MKRSVLVFAAILLLPSDSRAVTEGVGVIPRVGEPISGELEFLDEAGSVVRLSALLQGQPVLLLPVWFNCEKLCDLSLRELARTLDVMDYRNNITVLAVSIDPDEGPPDARHHQQSLRAEYPRLDIENDWHFLTADDSTINAWSDDTGIRFRYSSRLQQFLHPAVTVVMTPQGTISSYLHGVNQQPDTLRASIVAAHRGDMVEAGNSLLMLCYRYDEATGRYTLSVLKLIRLGAVLSIVLLAIFIFYLDSSRKRP
ncbi:MAG: SCO family protein [Pseudohongiellaceae bacterium]